MDLKLANKIVFISGGSRGIGKSIVRAFLSEGAKVAFIARNTQTIKSTIKILSDQFSEENIMGIDADASSETELKSVLETVTKKWGDIDILISNVGDGRSVPDPISEKEQFENVWRTNFTTAEILVREGLKYLRTINSNILFISSITGIEALGAPTDYSTAKAALIALSKNLARKLAPDIRVNSLAPGNIFFDGGSWDEKLKVDPDKVNSMLESAVPMKRFGTPEEIADAALFLCSARAKFITGSCLIIDGGQTVTYH